MIECIKTLFFVDQMKTPALQFTNTQIPTQNGPTNTISYVDEIGADGCRAASSFALSRMHPGCAASCWCDEMSIQKRLLGALQEPKVDLPLAKLIVACNLSIFYLVCASSLYCEEPKIGAKRTKDCSIEHKIVVLSSTSINSISNHGDHQLRWPRRHRPIQSTQIDLVGADLHVHVKRGARRELRLSRWRRRVQQHQSLTPLQ